MGHSREAAVGVHGDVHDSTTAVFKHPSVGNCLGHVPGSCQVGGHNGIKAFWADHLRGAEELTAAIVHQDVDPAELRHCARHQCIHLVAIPDVRDPAVDGCAKFSAQSSGGRIDAFAAARRNDDGGPQTRQLSAACGTDSGTATGDNGDPVLQQVFAKDGGRHAVP